MASHLTPHRVVSRSALRQQATVMAEKFHSLVASIDQVRQEVDTRLKVAILSWHYWQNTMGAIDDPVGSVLTLGGVAHEVVGVLPNGYDFLTPEVGIWVPMQQNPYEWSRSDRFAISVARMAPGVTMTQVKREMAQIAGELETEYPDTFRSWTMSETNLGTEFLDPQSRTYLSVLRASVFFVLLAVSTVASVLPATRAATVDPLSVLRSD